MLAAGQQHVLSLEDFKTIRDFIHEKSGMYFAESKMYLLQSRLGNRMEELGVASFKDYFYRVKYDSSHKEFNSLMNLVTTNETYYFRNEPQLESFASDALPKLIAEKKKNGSKSIRIWSAGCSTGEEPYTLGILILEALKGELGWQIEIIANDISEEVLQKARKAEYGGITLRYVKPEILDKHFVKTGDKYRVSTKIKAMVKFVQLNLNETHKFSMYRNLDFIFCRNVIIYFSEDVKKRIMKGFYQSLAPGGLLFIGHSETLHGISKSFKLRYLNGSLAYEKADGKGSCVTVAASAKVRPAASNTAMSDGMTGAQRAIELLAKIRANRAAQEMLTQRAGR